MRYRSAGIHVCMYSNQSGKIPTPEVRKKRPEVKKTRCDLYFWIEEIDPAKALSPLKLYFKYNGEL